MDRGRIPVLPPTLGRWNGHANGRGASGPGIAWGQIADSAAYLGLLRQGKRSPSRETAGRLLDGLGYRIGKTQTGAGTVDMVATDATGGVVVASAETRAPSSSVEERMERLVRQAERLEEHLQAAEPVVRALTSPRRTAASRALVPAAGPMDAGLNSATAGLERAPV